MVVNKLHPGPLGSLRREALNPSFLPFSTSDFPIPAYENSELFIEFTSLSKFTCWIGISRVFVSPNHFVPTSLSSICGPEMGVPIQAFPSNHLLSSSNRLRIAASRRHGKVDLELAECPLQEILQYHCNVQPDRAGKVKERIHCESVQRLFRKLVCFGLFSIPHPVAKKRLMV